MNFRNTGAIALRLLSLACRILGILLCALTIILCFNGMSARLGLVDLVIDLSRSLPSSIAGYGLVPSPFGGVFRLDFAVICAVLFLLDYLFDRVSRSIR